MDIHQDIIFNVIFSFIDVEEVLNASLVSRKWYDIAQQQRIWKRLFLLYFTGKRPPTQLLETQPNDEWKQYFKKFFGLLSRSMDNTKKVTRFLQHVESLKSITTSVLRLEDIPNPPLQACYDLIRGARFLRIRLDENIYAAIDYIHFIHQRQDPQDTDEDNTAGDGEATFHFMNIQQPHKIVTIHVCEHYGDYDDECDVVQLMDVQLRNLQTNENEVIAIRTQRSSSDTIPTIPFFYRNFETDDDELENIEEVDYGAVPFTKADILKLHDINKFLAIDPSSSTNNKEKEEIDESNNNNIESNNNNNNKNTDNNNNKENFSLPFWLVAAVKHMRTRTALYRKRRDPNVIRTSPYDNEKPKNKKSRFLLDGKHDVEPLYSQWQRILHRRQTRTLILLPRRSHWLGTFENTFGLLNTFHFILNLELFTSDVKRCFLWNCAHLHYDNYCTEFEDPCRSVVFRFPELKNDVFFQFFSFGLGSSNVLSMYNKNVEQFLFIDPELETTKPVHASFRDAVSYLGNKKSPYNMNDNLKEGNITISELTFFFMACSGLISVIDRAVRISGHIYTANDAFKKKKVFVYPDDLSISYFHPFGEKNLVPAGKEVVWN